MVLYTDNTNDAGETNAHNGSKLKAVERSITTRVPLRCGEPQEYTTLLVTWQTQRRHWIKLLKLGGCE